MARLFLTNRPGAFNRVRADWHAAGLREGVAVEDGRLGSASALKRAIDHDNALILAPDRWILGVGTYFTKDGTNGARALGELIAHLDRSDPRGARERLIGHYAIVARLRSRVVAMTDAAGTHDLFLRRSGDGIRIASFLSDLLDPGDAGRIDEVDALRAAYLGERGLAGRTIVPGIEAVRGYMWLEGDLAAPGEAGWTLRGAPPRPVPRLWTDEAEALGEFDRETGRVFGGLARAGPVAINATGGLDSRLMMAATRRSGARMRLLYGRGDSRMTNTRPEDLAVARAAAALWQCPLTLMDWRQPVPHDAAARRALQIRHGFRQPYGGTTGVITTMAGSIDPYPRMQLGGYNPAFTNLKPWATPDRPHDVEALAARAVRDAVRVASAPGTDPALARETILRTAADLRVLAEESGIEVANGDRVSREGAVRLLIRAREAKEAFNLQAFNQFGYYLAPFYTADLYDMLLDVPPDWRKGDAFQIRAIAAAAPEALALPIFSGVRSHALDRATMTMVPARPGPTSRLRLLAARMMRRDRTPEFRASLLAALLEGPAGRLDAATLAREDLRVVYRFVTAREIAACRE